MDQTPNILIVGGGLNGPALALALADAGLRVTLIDAQPARARAAADFDGRGYALALASQKMLVALGLWGDLRAQAQPIEGVKVSDSQIGAPPSPFVLEMQGAEIDDAPMGYMIEDRHLRPALLAALAKRPLITQIEGRVAAQAVDQSGATLTLEGGRHLNGALVVGCDGRASGTADRAGIKRMKSAYGQTALVCALHHTRPHGGIAHQLFLPPGPLAILPLPDNHCSIVWTERTDAAARIHALPDAEYMAVLAPRIGDFLGDLTLAGKRFTYPLALSLAQSFVAPRVALVGDAAHGLHPIAGQGLNAGLRDVAALAEVLVLAQRRGEDIGQSDVLARYQQWRRFDTAALALATDSFNRLFSNDNALLRLGRDLGMGIINALPSAKRTLIREAAGLTGDLPRLLQGQQI